MTELTRFADFVKNASTLERHKLASAIEAAASHMPYEDLKPLVEGLQQFMNAQAEQKGKKAARLAKVQAAQSDPAMQPLIKLVYASLSRLGIDINAAADNPNTLYDVDQKMKAQKWDSVRRFDLKSKMAAIGLID
jgi:hypothetical protein